MYPYRMSALCYSKEVRENNMAEMSLALDECVGFDAKNAKVVGILSNFQQCAKGTFAQQDAEAPKCSKGLR